MMLAIANYAQDNMAGAFPSYATLAKRCRVSRRTAMRVAAECATAGEIRIRHNGPNGSNFYDITVSASVTGDTPLVTQLCHPPSDTAMSPNPSISVNEPSSVANAPQVPIIIGKTPAPTVTTDIANATSLKRDESESPKKDGLQDFFDHAVKAKTAAAIIRKWNLPVHLQDTCLEFASVFGIEADGPTPTITARSKSKWMGSAAQLYEIRPTHAELIKARDNAAGKYPIAHPGAAVNTIINLRAMNPKVAPLTHSAPVVFRDKVVNDDDE
jgi:hypothetical protein